MTELGAEDYQAAVQAIDFFQKELEATKHILAMVLYKRGPVDITNTDLHEMNNAILELYLEPLTDSDSDGNMRIGVRDVA